jgi:hypothetical protein
MPGAVTALANLTLSSNATNVTFSSITNTYRDLILVLNTKSTSNDEVLVQLNNNSTNNNYPSYYMYGTGSASGAYANSSFWGYITTGNYTSTTNGDGYMSLIHFLDYSDGNKHKNFLIRTGNALNAVEAGAGRFASFSAISSIKIFTKNGVSFNAGSTFALYGVSA